MSFLERLRELGERLERGKGILVVGHVDADGITSTGIIVRALREKGKDVDYVNVKQLYRDVYDNLPVNEYDTVLFVDMGSGAKDLLEKEENVYVLDHHRPSGAWKNLYNPVLYGVSGDKEASSSTLAYLLSKAMGIEKGAREGIVGALGDVQDVKSGLNALVLRDAIREGVDAKKELKIYGKSTRPLPILLSLSTDPVIPGIGGNEEGAYRFLEEVGIDPGAYYVDLAMEEKRVLVTGIVYLLVRGERKGNVIGEVYEFLGEDPHSPTRFGREYATFLNACGKQGKPEVGVNVVMGDREGAMGEGLRILRRHREMIRRGIEVGLEGMGEGENIAYFFAGNAVSAEVIGSVCGLLSAGLFYGRKVVAGGVWDEGWIKISLRGGEELVRQGLNLAEVARGVVRELGGEGGGHKGAAGLRVPKDSWEEAVRIIDKLVGAQLGMG